MINLLLCTVIVFVGGFYYLWLTNPIMPNIGITFQEWWYNRPTFDDPRRYERYLKNRTRV